MKELIITEGMIENFSNYLKLEEKSKNTIDKYIRDIKAFQQYTNNRIVTKELAIEYK